MTRRKHWSLKNESKTFTLLTRRFDRSTTTESFRIFTFSNTRRPQQNKQTNKQTAKDSMSVEIDEGFYSRQL